VVANGPNDIWLTVTKGDLDEANPKYFFMHWDGRHWHTQAAPTIPNAPGASPDLVVAAGPDDLWAELDIRIGPNPARQYLVHWNGTSWAIASLPGGTDGLFDFARDGGGGLWAVGERAHALFSWCFLHYSGGHWAKITVPGQGDLPVAGVIELVQVPGTTTMLAGGLLNVPDQGTLGVVWQYGKGR
jgi:hypothetical protein